MPVPPAFGHSIDLKFFWRGVPYVEYGGDDDPQPQPEYGADQSTARRRIYTSHQYLTSAKLAFLGYPLARLGLNSEGSRIWYISRVTPHLLNAYGGVVLDRLDPAAAVPAEERQQYYFEAKDRLYCTRFRPKGLQPDPTPFDAPARVNNVAPGPFVPLQMTPSDEACGRYTYADCELTYAVPSYTVREDGDPLVTGIVGSHLGLPDESLLTRYTTRLPKPAGRLITTGAGWFYFDQDAGGGDPLPINEGTPVYKPSVDLQIIWHQVPANCVPYDSIQRCMGGVNDASFPLVGASFEPENVLFYGVDPQPCDLPTGEQGFNISYRFLVSPNIDGGGTKRGWNWFLRRYPVTPVVDYWPVHTQRRNADGSWTVGNPPYPRVSFNALFRPEVLL